MFKRKIYDQMVEWKKQKSKLKKALVIKGLRQVGKTYIANYFALKNYVAASFNRTGSSITTSSHRIPEMKLDLSLLSKKPENSGC